MKRIISILLLLLSNACPTTNCEAANGTLCMLATSSQTNYYLSITQWYQQCSPSDGNHFCSMTSLNETSCTQLLENGAHCKSNDDCIGRYCINGLCKSQQAKPGEACNSLYQHQCEKGYTCFNYVCAKAMSDGESCKIENGFDPCNTPYSKCFKGACTKLFSLPSKIFVSSAYKMMCESMAINEGGYCIERTELPSLKLAPQIEYKECSSDSDCEYTIGVVSSACNCAVDSQLGKKYCKLGGGEAFMVTAAKNFISYYHTSATDMEHDSKLTQLYMLAHNEYRNQFVAPAECSYSQFLKGREGKASSISFYLVVSLVCILCIVPLVTIIIGMITMC